MTPSLICLTDLGRCNDAPAQVGYGRMPEKSDSISLQHGSCDGEVATLASPLVKKRGEQPMLLLIHKIKNGGCQARLPEGK